MEWLDFHEADFSAVTSTNEEHTSFEVLRKCLI